jgi:hypothetical protein
LLYFAFKNLQYRAGGAAQVVEHLYQACTIKKKKKKERKKEKLQYSWVLVTQSLAPARQGLYQCLFALVIFQVL